MTYIILAGPSSVGKSSYARKHFKDYYVIDSDDIWFKLAEDYNYDREKIEKEIFKRMYDIAKTYTNAVLVHTDPTPLLKYFDRKEITILLLGTHFRNLARNVSKRQDRAIENVFSNKHVGYLFYFEQTNSKEKSIYLRKKDLDKIPIKTKKDKIAIENIKSAFFKKDKKTTRITPKSSIDYDAFIAI